LGVLYNRYLNKPQDALKMYKACLKLCNERKMPIPIWLEPAIQQLSKGIYLEPKSKIKPYPKLKPRIIPKYKPLPPKPKPTPSYEREVIRLQKLIEDKRKVNDINGVANAYYNLGKLHLDYKKYVEAKAIFKKVLVIKEEMGDKRWIGTCYVMLGIVNMYQGNYNQAEILYNKALTLSVETNYEYLITLCYHNLGVLYDRYLNKPQDALKMYKACLKLYKERKMPIPVWLEPAIQRLS
ncbi:MAG: tetratricopeptide repeat protein, partial [Candidatus Humimicrobiia bacterium]